MEIYLKKTVQELELSFIKVLIIIVDNLNFNPTVTPLFTVRWQIASDSMPLSELAKSSDSKRTLRYTSTAAAPTLVAKSNTPWKVPEKHGTNWLFEGGSAGGFLVLAGHSGTGIGVMNKR